MRTRAGRSRRWLAQGEAHAQAWGRAEQVLGAFDGLPARIGHDVLRATGKRRGRRAVLRAMLGLGVAAPSGWLAWREAPAWRADLRTAAGEQLTRSLDDGTRLVLNSGSAVDLRYGAAERRLVLVAGEVLVTTGQETQRAYRPFVVQTPQGEAQALGTRFSVRLIDDRTEVMVFEHAVLARPAHGAPVRIDAGQRGSFTRGQCRPRSRRWTTARRSGSKACWSCATSAWPMSWPSSRGIVRACCAARPRSPGCACRARCRCAIPMRPCTPWPTACRSRCGA